MDPDKGKEAFQKDYKFCQVRFTEWFRRSTVAPHHMKRGNPRFIETVAWKNDGKKKIPLSFA